MSALDELADRWSAAERVVVLTGAGISTASGIPDFRSPGGRWERYQPVTSRPSSPREEARAEYWRYKGETWQLIRAAQPNAAHLALSDLAGAGRLRAAGHAERGRPPRAERVSCGPAGDHPRHGLPGAVPPLPPARAPGGRAAGVGGWSGGAALPVRRALEAGHDLVRPVPGRTRTWNGRSTRPPRVTCSWPWGPPSPWAPSTSWFPIAARAGRPRNPHRLGHAVRPAGPVEDRRSAGACLPAVAQRVMGNTRS